MLEEHDLPAYHRKHNYFATSDYLRHKTKDTALELGYGGVGMMCNEDFIVGLQEGLEAEVGEASALIMYQCGLEWGKLDMEKFEARMQKEFNRSMRNMNVNFMLETWWWPLTAAGWGSWKVDTSRVKQGYIVVDLVESAVAKSLEFVGKPVCHLYAGLLAGSMTHLVRNELSSIEIQCYAMGEDICRFLIGSEKRVDAAEFWLNEGAQAKEILRKLEGN
ncbi:MAG: 4-vinyl reductase [Deltaproteobacteria bacterium]|nr:MAG: 4-vinyl reductase [Deltaproteobacteria bacterium]